MAVLGDQTFVEEVKPLARYYKTPSCKLKQERPAEAGR